MSIWSGNNELPPNDIELSRLCDKVAGLINNGPWNDYEPDLEMESSVRYELRILLKECENKARKLCEFRGIS